MKKILAILIAAVLALSTCGVALAEEAADSPVGVWYLQSMEQQEGMQMDATVLSSMGMTLTLTLNEDGTAVMNMSGTEQEGTWTEDGTLNFGETPLTFSVEDGQLQFEQNGSKAVFGPEPAETKTYEITPAVTDPALEDFNGNYKAVIYYAMGMQLPMNVLGVDFSLDIQDGKVAFTETDYDRENGYAVSGTVEKEFTAEVAEDGTLFVDFAGEEVLTALNLPVSGIHLTLHEDGLVTGNIPEIDQQMKEQTEQLQAMSEASQAEGETAESAEGESPAEEAEGESPEAVQEAGEFAEAEGEGASEGDSEGGSSGSSSGSMDFTTYFIFEKAE